MENIVVKGEIGRFEQFLLLSLCFKKLSAAEASESAYMRERVNPFLPFPTHNQFAADDFENIKLKIWKLSIN